MALDGSRVCSMNCTENAWRKINTVNLNETTQKPLPQNNAMRRLSSLLLIFMRIHSIAQWVKSP